MKELCQEDSLPAWHCKVPVGQAGWDDPPWTGGQRGPVEVLEAQYRVANPSDLFNIPNTTGQTQGLSGPVEERHLEDGRVNLGPDS